MADKKGKLMKERLGMIDVLRLVAVFIIFLFHSNIHIGCTYSILTPFISMGAIFMTAFFIISGFSIFYVNNEMEGYYYKEKIWTFYKKRIVSIMPMYWSIVVVYPIWDVFFNKGSIKNNIILMPIELLGMQSVFHSLFGYTHNGGTWFVSCIIFCYLIFPFVYTFIKDAKAKFNSLVVVTLEIILIYSPFLAEYMSIEEIYSNIFFRMIEFVIGMLLCSIWLDVKDTIWYKQIFANNIFFTLIILVLITTVSVLARMNFMLGNYMAYSFIGLPCFSLLAFSGAGIKTPEINSSQIIKYAVSISYVFFFSQFFTWKITIIIINTLGVDTNIIRIVTSFFVCTLITIIMHEVIEKPLKLLLSKIIYTA